ncbi:glycerophosphodiester phosphodiesterase [Microlunatus capsulatus]|uniref:Glycerophosphoryl diester phosphodiesterase n=1 Tax=Microlunatus capsulatus TaxID=99117 RepID=A0ABS4Z2E1_9ACTN|nr:glycerophosphodiester phosphodiesterase [Microlunatus capsulatus]MBP2415144.1 glycerophosphoryl diester phosphodiesterase [Microlunatus capsulatus]
MDAPAAPARTTRVADLVFPLTISHRGGPDIYPENSWEAKEGSVASGFVPEFDLQLLADGRTLVSCHDATVDRTMTGIGSGHVSTKSVAEWTTARIRPAIPGGREGRPILWDEVLDRWGGRVVLVPELKDPAGATAFVDGIVRRGLEASVLAQTFDWTIAQQVAAAGIATMFLSHRSPAQPAEALTGAGIGFVGADLAGWTTAEVRALQAAGLRVVGFTVGTTAEATTPLALACDGLFSDDAWLTTHAVPVQSGDPFGDGVRPFGMGAPYRSPGVEVLDPPIRLAGRGLGWSQPTGVPTYARAPWAGVVERPVRVALRVHFGPSEDQADDAGFVLLRDAMERRFVEGPAEGQDALLVVVARDGRLEARRYVDGATGVVLGVPVTSPVPLVAPGAEGVVELSAVLTTTTVRLHAQGAGAAVDAVLDDAWSPGPAGLVLRWPGTRAPGFPGFLSDVSVVRLA